MTIFSQLANGTPFTANGFACSQDSAIITKPDEDVKLDFCYCEYECDYTEYAFYEVGGDTYTNDQASLLIDTIVSSGTVVFKLINAYTDVETILNDNTYGTFYAKGDLEGHPEKTGMLVDWQKVGTIIGNGVYFLRSELTVFGSTFTTDTHNYKVMPYSIDMADGTVKIITYHDGAVESGLDYTGLNWLKSVRLKGLFSQAYEYESIEYVNTSRKNRQIQDRVTNLYTLETSMLPSNVADPFMIDKILANEINMYDYNIFNYKNYRGVKLRPVSIEDNINFPGQSTRMRFVITFKDETENNIKHN